MLKITFKEESEERGRLYLALISIRTHEISAVPVSSLIDFGDKTSLILYYEANDRSWRGSCSIRAKMIQLAEDREMKREEKESPERVMTNMWKVRRAVPPPSLAMRKSVLNL